jgi:hypothetical protein
LMTSATHDGERIKMANVAQHTTPISR